MRQLVEEVVVDIEGTTEVTQVEIRWVGGHRTQTSIVRPVNRFDQLSYYDELIARLRELLDQDLTSKEIANLLNLEGWRPPKRSTTFTHLAVRGLIYKHRFQRPTSQKPRKRTPLRANESWLPDLAAKLEMPAVSLYSWIRRGWARARQVEERHRPWAVWADANELARLRAFRDAPKRGWRGRNLRIARA